MLFKAVVLTLLLISPAIAEDISGPPSIFSVEQHASPADKLLKDPVSDIFEFTPYGELPELTEEGALNSLDNEFNANVLSQVILEEKPYKANISILNRRTNILKRLTFNELASQKTFKEFHIHVAQCLKDNEGKFGNDIAFVEISDSNKNILFNGWLFKRKPSAAVFEHPVYNLSLISCS